MKRGQRVILIADYTNEWDDSYKAGQTGTVIFVREPFFVGERAIVTVDLDGYEEERAANAQRRARYGEGFNIVPFFSYFPVENLRVIE